MPTVLTTSAVFSSLSTLFVSLRFFTRIQLVRSVGKDDYMILASVLFAWCSFGFLTQEIRYGLGDPMAKVLKEHTMEEQLKALWLSIPFYNFSLTFTKVSILFLYMRIFTIPRFLLVARIVMGVVIVYGLWTVLSAFLNCIPVNAFWDSSVDGGCIPKGFLWYFNAGMNITTDLVILSLPIPVLSHLRLALRQKVGLLLIFATGVFACATSIIRLRALTIAAGSSDPTKDNAPIGLWSSVEMNMGIICACLPPLRPLVTRLFPRLMPTVSRSRSKRDRYRQGYYPHNGAYPFANECSASTSGQAHDKSQNEGIVVTQELKMESSKYGVSEEMGSERESERGLVLRDL